MMTTDLRSDTVTKPCPAMRQAMASADVGDDVQMEDPTVAELEALGAELTGMEAGLFVASGTQGNLVAQLTHCVRGQSVILGSESHINHYEMGGMAALGGLFPVPVDDSRGIPHSEDIRAAAYDSSNVHTPPTRLLCLENTHNRAGGLAVPVDDFTRVTETARNLGLAIHLDGARLFNAAAAHDCEARVYAEQVDSVQICLSKGLGAPIGSLLCGSKEFIGTSRRWRKCVGGGMRQVGVIAAAGLIALGRNRARLGEDHESARMLARRLTEGGLAVEENPWMTNMVFFRVAGGPSCAKQLCRRCGDKGVLFNATKDRVRLVIHLDVSRQQVMDAADIILTAAHEPCA